MTRIEQASQTHDIAARMELADRMVKQPSVAQESLESLFTGAMQRFENCTNQTFAPSLRERVWERVFRERLVSLKEYFLSEFSDKILGDFKNEEVKAMLEEHKRTGFISNNLYNGIISGAYHFNREAVIDSVVLQARLMLTPMIPEMAKAITDEGIKLSIPGYLTV